MGKVSDISKQLTRGYAHHGFCINIEEARELGLVVEEIPDDQIDTVHEIQRIQDKIYELKSKSGNSFSDASSMTIAGQSVSFSRSGTDAFYNQSIYHI